MALKKKNKVVSMFSLSDYEKMAQEYDDVSKQLKVLTDRKKVLSEQLKKGAEELGSKDDKGSYYCNTDSFVFGKQAKKSVTINLEKAIPFLRKKHLDSLIHEEVVYSIDKDELQDAVSEGSLTVDDVKSITDVEVSYSVSVKAREEVPEIEQTTLVAAKRK